MEIDKDVFRELGMTDSETKVYIALLELGEATRGDIVSVSKVSGSKVYELLQKLQEKGFISVYIKNKIKHFKTTNPSQILSYIREKEERLAKIEKEVSNMLPSLLSKYSTSKKEQEVELITGLKGLDIIFKEQVDLLSPGDTCYVIGGTRGEGEEAVQSFFERVHMWRQGKKIKTRMLFNKTQKESTEKLYSSKRFPYTSTRYIKHTSPVAINIYRDRTVIIIFGKEISAIHIKSEEVAKSFLEYFEILWRS